MNSQCVMSVVTADHFQHYIPLFLRCMRRWGDGVDSQWYLRGKPDDMLLKAMDCLTEFGIAKEYDSIAYDSFSWMPDTESSTNLMRFLHCCEDKLTTQYGHTLIVDVDLLLFADPFPYHIKRMSESMQPFYGHHGPWKKPYRPEINKDGWTGDFERVAGGFFLATPQWYTLTAKARIDMIGDLNKMQPFRELDEVVLARIIKLSGMKVPQDKHFPAELRGVHLGDFKESMTHRWTSMAKMITKLTDDNCRHFVAIERDPCWQELLKILAGDTVLMQILENVRKHCRDRGLA